nr:hypothetical protein [Tanacetum cinerariifolium]
MFVWLPRQQHKYRGCLFGCRIDTARRGGAAGSAATIRACLFRGTSATIRAVFGSRISIRVRLVLVVIEHADDEIVAEDQPYAEDASPIAQGDDGDDEEESSEDDEDDDMDIEADEEEEEEHPAPADSVVVALTAADQASYAEETEPFETDESAASPPPHPIPFPPLPPILSPPSPVLSPAPPPSPIRSLGYRAAMIRLRAEAASTSPSPPLQLPSASRREDRPEVTLPPQKRLVSTDTELGGYMREFEMRVRQDTDEIYMRLDEDVPRSLGASDRCE